MEHLYSLFHWTTRKTNYDVVTHFEFHTSPNIVETTFDSLDYNSNYLTEFYSHKEIAQYNSSKEFYLYDTSNHISFKDGNIFSLLKSAIIRKESIDSIRMILSKDLKQSLSQTDDLGNNLLHIATRHEHLDAMKEFLSSGVDVNSKNSRGDTPLHLTLVGSSNQFLQLTRVLVEHGADLNSVDDSGNSFAHLCAARLNQDNFRASVTTLITLGYDHLFCRINDLNQTPLHIAILRKMDIDLETLKLISTASGYDFNERYSEGDTLLHYAARWGGGRYVLENIIALGGNWRLKNSYLKTVLHCAVAGSNKRAIKYFLSLGADVNARDFLGRTPLHHIKFTKSNDLIEITKLLLMFGADINAVDDCGNKVAHHLSMSVSNELYAEWSSLIRNFESE